MPRPRKKVDGTGAKPGRAAAGRHDSAAETHAREIEVQRLRDQIAEFQDQLEALTHGAPPAARLSELERELEHRRLRSEREHELARDFQKRLCPAFLPKTEGVSFTVTQRVADKLGGDLYDVYTPGPGSIGFLLSDASSYGLRAALLNIIAKNGFDSFRVNEYSPKLILERLNSYVLNKTPENQFLTAFFAVLDCATLRLRYVNASFPSPIIYGKERFETLDGHGLFVGLFENPEYEEREVQLRTGDHLLLYSDGVCNALNGEGRIYSVERLHDMVRKHTEERPGPLLASLLADIDQHLDKQPPTDDITLLSATFSAVVTASETMEVASEPANLPRVVTPVINRLRVAGWGERVEFGIRLALEEALINAMKHGNKMDRSKKIHVHYELDDKRIVIRVADEGNGFDPAAVPDPTTEENIEVSHGRGLLLMRSYAEVSFNEKGNEVTLVKSAPWA